MPKDTKTLGNNKARACESLGFVHKKDCARVLYTSPFFISLLLNTKIAPTYKKLRLSIYHLKSFFIPILW